MEKQVKADKGGVRQLWKSTFYSQILDDQKKKTS